MRPAFVRLENNPDYLGGIPEGETLLILRFRHPGRTRSRARCDIAFPASAFGPVRDVFDPESRSRCAPSKSCTTTGARSWT